MISGAFIYAFMQYLAVSDDLRYVTEKQAQTAERLLEERNVTTQKLAEIRSIGVRHAEQIKQVQSQIEALQRTLNRLAGPYRQEEDDDQKEYTQWRE